jgi:mannose-1-phosphate guanylyltransferase/mannose-6-phosphate isomerase
MSSAPDSDRFHHVYPVLLAGGTGTRLWPVSRQLYPKQLVKFIGNASLIQNTISRLIPLVDPENVRVVCGAEHYYEIDRHLRDIHLPARGKIIPEPCGRNTAPAVLMAMFHVMERDENAVMCIFPADHVIRDVIGFQDSVRMAVALAEEGHIVTFGIRPHYPETGYGYIEAGEPLNKSGFRVRRFVEKPDRVTAEAYLKAGNFFWNSGMFTFKLPVMMEEFQRYAPDLFQAMKAMVSRGSSPDPASYKKLPDISIDYAIMEQTRKAAVLPSDFGWSDIGSWKSLFDFMPKNSDENVVVGDVVTKDTQNCFIMGQDRLIATNHVRDLVIVDTQDSVFVSDIENSRDVKSIVSMLKETGRKEFYQHLTVYHEWGKSTILHQDPSTTVCHLTLFPEKVLNLPEGGLEVNQLTVTAGEVTATGLDEDLILTRGRSITLARGSRAAVRNLKEVPAQMVAIGFKRD